MNPSLADATLESRAVGAVPVVQHFLQRLRLPELLQQYLPVPRGRPAQVPTAVTLTTLLTNLLLARQPLYAIPDWIAQQVPEHLGLTNDQVSMWT